MAKPITTSQTIGPFPHEGWRWAFDEAGDVGGAAIAIAGRVLDGDAAPIDDAVLEAWSPSAARAEEGSRPRPGFRRVPTDENGEFRFALPRSDRPSGVPFAYVTIFARGLLKHQFCAVFLEDDAGLADAPLLMQVPAGRRATLVAAKAAAGEYRWDIRLQGDAETVFFDYE